MGHLAPPLRDQPVVCDAMSPRHSFVAWNDGVADRHFGEPAHRTLEHAGTGYCVVVCLYGEGYASLLACAGGHLASFMYTPFNPNTMPRRALREGPFPQDFLSLIAA